MERGALGRGAVTERGAEVTVGARRVFLAAHAPPTCSVADNCTEQFP